VIERAWNQQPAMTSGCNFRRQLLAADRPTDRPTMQAGARPAVADKSRRCGYIQPMTRAGLSRQRLHLTSVGVTAVAQLEIQEAQLPQRNSASAAHVYRLANLSYNAQNTAESQMYYSTTVYSYRQYQLRKRPKYVTDEVF